MRLLFLLVLGTAVFAQPSTDLNQALAGSRQRIDSIDSQIIRLLNERAQVVRDVGEIKQRYHAPASAPGREARVLQLAGAQAKAPLTPEAVEAIFRTILHEMSSMEATEMRKGSNPR